MLTITRAQRLALKEIYDRGPLVLDPETKMFRTPRQGEGYYLGFHPVSYREFRRRVRPMFFDSCILIPWQGMWLGIELNGHTHS